VNYYKNKLSKWFLLDFVRSAPPPSVKLLPLQFTNKCWNIPISLQVKTSIKPSGRAEICKDRVYWRTVRTWEIQNTAEWNTLKNKEVGIYSWSFINEAEEPPLAAIRWSNLFIFDFISLIIVEEFFLTLLYTVVGICICTALLRSHHSISIGLRSGLQLGHCNTLILFFFSHSLVDLLVIFGSLSSCITQFWPSFSCRTDGLTFDSLVFRGVYGRLNDCEVPRHTKQA